MPQAVLTTQRLVLGRRVDGLGSRAGFRDGQFVGIWMLQLPPGPSQRPVPGEADLGYRLLRRHWRRGYAREGVRELIRHGFEDLGLVRVLAQTMAVNTPSRATMRSVGMRFVRAFHGEFDEPVAGHEHGEVEYELRHRLAPRPVQRQGATPPGSEAGRRPTDARRRLNARAARAALRARSRPLRAAD